ncbi:MAG: hypothetical protein HYU73_26300, partial [Betaproteobacteria bacterium]|nr:hypothetical protein [Betaproteobacteria bacterium]
GNWSVRALKRQVATLYFERSGLSADKEKLAALAHAAAEQAEPKLAIRHPYVFEFLGLRPKEAVSESALVEYALAAIDSRLFVSKYQLELPSKEDLQRFLEEKRREMNDRG